MPQPCEHATHFIASRVGGYVTLTAIGRFLDWANKKHTVILRPRAGTCPPEFELQHDILNTPGDPEYAVSTSAPVAENLEFGYVLVHVGSTSSPVRVSLGGQPLASLAPTGEAAELKYTLPDASSYSGQNYIWFNDLKAGDFKDEVRKAPPHALRNFVKNYDAATLQRVVLQQIVQGFRGLLGRRAITIPGRDVPPAPIAIDDVRLSLTRPRLGPGDPAQTQVSKELGSLIPAAEGATTDLDVSKVFPRLPKGYRLQLGKTTGTGQSTLASTTEPEVDVAPGGAEHLYLAFANRLGLTPELVARNLLEYRPLILYRNLFGNLTFTFGAPEPAAESNLLPEPKLLIKEECRHSTFFGSYGAGRTLKTFSLLPGEKSRITIRSFTKRETDAKQASSVFDSFSEESATEFSNSIAKEQSNRDTWETTNSWNASASGGGSWGFFSASASGGASGQSKAAHDGFAKNVSTAASKHAAQASAKREVRIETSYEARSTTEDESSVVREIENVNVGRTLNFVFRQMNQEFISAIHIVDIRVAFTNGVDYEEVELPQLVPFLTRLLKEKAKVEETYQAILKMYSEIPNWSKEKRTLIKEEFVPAGEKYLTVEPGVTTISDYPERSVPGVVLRVDTNVLRTDGVIVESVLGKGQGLDPYSHGLQVEAVRERKLLSDIREVAVQAAQQEKDDKVRLELLKALLASHCCPSAPTS